MKINIPVRMKNPWFWVGIGAVILSSLNVTPETFTSWQAVADCFIATIENPYKLITCTLAVLAVFVDPTTAGLSDSLRAMQYKTPSKGGI